MSEISAKYKWHSEEQVPIQLAMALLPRNSLFHIQTRWSSSRTNKSRVRVSSTDWLTPLQLPTCPAYSMAATSTTHHTHQPGERLCVVDLIPSEEYAPPSHRRVCRHQPSTNPTPKRSTPTSNMSQGKQVRGVAYQWLRISAQLPCGLCAKFVRCQEGGDHVESV